MIEFGKTLRDARESKGYTISQIAELTHLKSTIVEQLENEDFSSIAAPIYGRGFVKLYCETVGLDPKPLINEFMAIMNGDREVSIKERPGASADNPWANYQPSTPPVQEPLPFQEPPAQETTPFQQPLPFQEPSMPEPQPMPEPPPEPPMSFQQPPMQQPAPFQQPPMQQPMSFQQPPIRPAFPEREAPPQTPPLSRYSKPISNRSPIPDVMPSFNPRIFILGGCAIALVIILVLGLRALYRATKSDEPQAPDPTTVTAPATPTPQQAAHVTAAAERTERQHIPALYFD